MTENEVIELLRSMQNPKQDYAEVVCSSFLHWFQVCISRAGRLCNRRSNKSPRRNPAVP